MNTIKNNIMKRGVIILAVVVAACGGPATNENIEMLVSKRDSLQKEQFKLDKELNKLNEQIALLDSSVSKDDIKTQKKITMQKNRMAATQLKIKSLEGQLSVTKEDNLTPVAVKEINGELFNHYIIVYGKVQAEKYAMISPEMGGRVKSVHVDEGQRVNKGDLLVSLNTDAVQKQIEGIKSSLEFATETYNKQDALWKEGIGSEIQYLQAKNTKDNLESQLEALQAQKRMSQIRAPFSGIVNKIFMKVGELASPGFPVVEFVNMSRMTIKADVPERYISDVKVGQSVNLSFASLPDYTLNTPIKRVSKVINSASRTFEIELAVKNADEKIKPNMVSTIKINDFSNNDAFVVPSLVIRKDITGNYVYLANEKEGKTIVSKQYITTGMAYSDESLVLEGLSVGDRVIVEGYHMVSSGVPVKVVE